MTWALGNKITSIAARHRAAGSTGTLLDLAGPALPAAVTLSRASGAGAFDATGTFQTVGADVPRFDHAPFTGTPQGLLVETATTNMLLQSTDHANGAWSRNSFTDSGGTETAPDGSLVPVWTFGNGYLFQNVTLGVGVTHTASMWIKANTTGVIGFRAGAGSGGTGDNVGITLTPAWQRIERSKLASGTSGRFLLDNRAAEGYGVAGLTIALWGCQVEARDAASSPLATGASPVTRAADVVATTGLAGLHDVRITYDDGSTDDLLSVTITEGWWPSLSRERVRQIRLYPDGTL